MPFKKLTLDSSGKAYWVQPDDPNIAIVNNSAGTITLTDGADVFPILASTLLSYTTRPGTKLAFEGTAGLTFVVFWGSFFRARNIGIGQIYKDAFVQKNPTAQQTILGYALAIKLSGLVFQSKLTPNAQLYMNIPPDIGTEAPFLVATVDSDPNNPGALPYRVVTFESAPDPGGYKRAYMGDTTLDAVSFRVKSVMLGAPSAGVIDTDPDGTFEIAVLPRVTGAQVGQPTGTTGTGVGVAGSGHRHAFSGRFMSQGFIRDASLGGATPAKFARIISNNNWTLRRISVYALTAPAGTGNDAYGIVNAAGTLQGTAVTLAVGAIENATALQVTNLTGGTVYYIAVTGRATTPASDVNVELEYTMNV